MRPHLAFCDPSPELKLFVALDQGKASLADVSCHSVRYSERLGLRATSSIFRLVLNAGSCNGQGLNRGTSSYTEAYNKLWQMLTFLLG